MYKTEVKKSDLFKLILVGGPTEWKSQSVLLKFRDYVRAHLAEPSKDAQGNYSIPATLERLLEIGVVPPEVLMKVVVEISQISPSKLISSAYKAPNVPWASAAAPLFPAIWDYSIRDWRFDWNDKSITTKALGAGFMKYYNNRGRLYEFYESSEYDAIVDDFDAFMAEVGGKGDYSKTQHDDGKNWPLWNALGSVERNSILGTWVFETTDTHIVRNVIDEYMSNNRPYKPYPNIAAIKSNATDPKAVEDFFFKKYARRTAEEVLSEIPDAPPWEA